VTQDRLSIIAEGQGEHGECLFLSDDLRFYVRNLAYPFMQSPALSLCFNEKDKFLLYQGTISPQSALSLLWTLDDEHARARDTLTAYVADAPRLHIVAHFRTDSYTDYFLDNRLTVHTTAPYARGPFWPANDPTFFNLKDYFQPSNKVSVRSFRGHFLPGQEHYETKLEEKLSFLDGLLRAIQDEGLDAPAIDAGRLALPELFTSSLYQDTLASPEVLTFFLKQRPRLPLPTNEQLCIEQHDVTSPPHLQALENYQAPLLKPAYYRRILS